MEVSAQSVERLLVQSPLLEGQLNQIGDKIQGALRGFVESQGDKGTRARNFLNGVWLGHPLHAALSDLPIGAWTVATIADYLGALTGDEALKKTGDWSTALGTVGGLFAAVAGLADYSEVDGKQRRVATIHGLLNVLSLTLMGWSVARRLAGQRASAIPLATIGYLISFVAADAGGLMVYRYGATVNRDAWMEAPDAFTAVFPTHELLENQLRTGTVGNTTVLLTRVRGEIYAAGDTCSHWGCSLAEGKLDGTKIQCPCHGSTFSLADGSVERGPASAPQPTFDVRERGGQIEVRIRPY